MSKLSHLRVRFGTQAMKADAIADIATHIVTSALSQRGIESRDREVSVQMGSLTLTVFHGKAVKHDAEGHVEHSVGSRSVSIAQGDRELLTHTVRVKTLTPVELPVDAKRHATMAPQGDWTRELLAMDGKPKNFRVLSNAARALQA